MGSKNKGGIHRMKKQTQKVKRAWFNGVRETWEEALIRYLEERGIVLRWVWIRDFQNLRRHGWKPAEAVQEVWLTVLAK